MQVFFARQPILNQNLQLYGYELLYRGSTHAADAPADDGDAATVAVVEGLQARGIESITRGKKAFINFTRNLLLSGIAAYFPPKNIVVEVLETVEPSPELIDALMELKSKGYTLALDDFAFRAELVPLMKLADIIKLDYMDDKVSDYVRAVRAHTDQTKCTLLAEKVENKQVFETAREHGCRLFQGYFFAKPSATTEKTVGVMRSSSMRLVAEVNREDVNFNAVTDIIKQDVGLSYRLLKLVNSPYFGITREITDLKKAIVFLGHNELKKWISYVALFSMADNKPPELLEMSMVRARFCETVAAGLAMPRDAFFLGGLFSMLDAMLDAPIEDTIKDIRLPETTYAALCGEQGALRATLDLIIALENGDWDEVERLRGRPGFDELDFSKLYADALEWTARLYTEG
jgi:EAL and modified HD-GYP domain-containing signal transduction protein